MLTIIGVVILIDLDTYKCYNKSNRKGEEAQFQTYEVMSVNGK